MMLLLRPPPPPLRRTTRYINRGNSLTGALPREWSALESLEEM